MANTYTTTLDSATYKAVQDIKKEKGITGGQLIRLGLQAATEGNPLKAKIHEMEQEAKNLRGKYQQLALKVYQMQDKKVE